MPIKKTAGVLLALLMLIAPVRQANSAPPEPDMKKRDELYSKLEVLAESINIILTNYVEETKADDLVTGAINGMLFKLDPHSGYMPPHAFEEEQMEMKGSFDGVGLEIAIQNEKIIVITPIEDGPAHLAGVQAGDVIIMIGNEPTAEMVLTDAVKKLRGPKGTKIPIKVLREGSPDPISIEITRDTIKMKSVKVRKTGGIGIIRLTRFQKDSHIEVNEALTSLGKIDGLVLDIRNNPGGLLDQAVKVSDLFLKGGRIVSTKGRDPAQETVFNARDDGNEPVYPIVVLINRGSASAAEIVAGALQDQKRALVMGERSFGKGSVQTMFNLSDGSGLRVTSALYYTPSDRSIQAKGIIPDMEVPDGMNPPLALKKEDRVHEFKREEDIKGHFLQPVKDGKEGAVPKKTDKPEPEPSEPGKKPGDDKTEEKQDRQLERAVELLNNWKLMQEINTRMGRTAD